MFTKLRKATIGAAITVVLVAGLMVAPVGMLPGSTGTQKAAASCDTSYFRIVWGQVGIRGGPYGAIVAYAYYGQVYDGPTGGTSGGWTIIRYVDQHYGNHYGYIPQDSRVYLGCS